MAPLQSSGLKRGVTQVFQIVQTVWRRSKVSGVDLGLEDRELDDEDVDEMVGKADIDMGSRSARMQRGE